MRPLFLSIEGINSFIERQEIDFELVSQDRIFCISGPTGSGKTTILDSIIIALFAPRNHNRGTLKEYVNTKCSKGEVVFRFSFENGIYEVKRVLKASGTSGYLKRLDTGEVLADQSEKVTDLIREMIKINHEDFTKVVILEQGKFAKFITEQPTARYEFLSKLFNFDRFNSLKNKFNNLEKMYAETARNLREKTEELKDVTKQNFDAYIKEEKRLTKLGAEQEALRESLTKKRIELEKQRADYEARENARARQTAALSALEGAKNDKIKLNGLATDVAALKTLAQDAESKEKTARENLAKITECERDLALKAEKTAQRDSLVLKYKNTEKLYAEMEESLRINDAQALQEMLLTAESQKDELVKSNAAAAVAAHLKSGDSCPVCGGVYGGMTVSEDSGKIEALNITIKNLRARIDRAARDSVEREKLRGERQNIITDGERVRDDIKRLTSVIEERVGQADLAKLKDAAQKDISESYNKRRQYEDKAKEFENMNLSYSALVAANSEKLNQASKEAERLEGASYDKSEAEKLLQDCEQNDKGIKEITKQLTDIKVLLNGYEKKLLQKKQYAEQKEEVGKLLDNATALKKMFEKNSFLEFVSREYILGFTDAASVILSGLTDGKYTLEYEADTKEFLVRDFLANNETRKVKTLSGGETFLASMSVAIAISREIASDKNFEFFFLDEGFGTLHEKAIDTVAEALKKLSYDTIVGLVSHRSELTERIASRLIITPAVDERGSVINFVCG